MENKKICIFCDKEGKFSKDEEICDNCNEEYKDILEEPILFN